MCSLLVLELYVYHNGIAHEPGHLTLQLHKCMLYLVIAGDCLSCPANTIQMAWQLVQSREKQISTAAMSHFAIVFTDFIVHAISHIFLCFVQCSSAIPDRVPSGTFATNGHSKIVFGLINEVLTPYCACCLYVCAIHIVCSVHPVFILQGLTHSMLHFLQHDSHHVRLTEVQLTGVYLAIVVTDAS